MAHSGHDLGPHCVPVLHERQEPMGARAGDDLKLTQFKELPEGAHEVASVLLLEHIPGVLEHVPVHMGQGVEVRLVPGPMDLLLGKLDEPRNAPQIPLLEQRVRQHGDERGRKAHGDAEVHAVLHQPVKDIDERDVGLGDGLVEPVLFEELFVLRVPHIGQMAVQHQREISFFHASSSCKAEYCGAPAVTPWRD